MAVVNTHNMIEVDDNGNAALSGRLIRLVTTDTITGRPFMPLLEFPKIRRLLLLAGIQLYTEVIFSTDDTKKEVIS